MKSILKPVGYSFLVGSLLVGCVNSDYDLNKDINTDITVGTGGIFLPIGNTEKIEMSDLITESDDLVVVDKLYTIIKKGTIDEKNVSIDPVFIQVTTPILDPVLVDFYRPSTASFASRNYVLDALMQTASTISIDELVPAELRMLRKASMQGKLPEFTIRLSFDQSVVGQIEKMSLVDFQVILPSFLKFDDPAVVNDTLTINSDFNPRDGYVKSLRLKEIDFSKWENGGVVCTSQGAQNSLVVKKFNSVSMAGRVRIETNSLNPGDLKDFVITPAVELDAFSLGMVEGIFEPQIDPIKEELALDLGEGLEFIEQDGVLDLHNPQIKLQIGNTMGIPVDAVISMRGLDSLGTTVPGSEVVLQPLKINGSPTNGENHVTRYLISKQAMDESGFVNVVSDKLSDLMRRIPKKIAMNIAIESNHDEYHAVDLATSVKKSVSGSYDVVVPLQFDAITLRYVEPINDVQDLFDGLAEEQEELTLEIKTQSLSALPIDMDLTALAYDLSGDLIPEIVCKDATLVKGEVANPQTTDAVIALTIPKGTHKQISRIDLVIAGDEKNEDGLIELREDQYIQLNKIGLRIKGGVNIEL